MADGRIEYRVEDGLAHLTIDQPARHNAMSFDMWASLPGLVATAEADPQVRAIVVSGAGERAFCSGADISQFGEKRSGASAVEAYEQAVSGGLAALSSGAKPSVALVRGICFGGGLALALSCDLRLVAEGARFRIPAARLGLGYAYPNVAMMARRLGPGATADILFSARGFDAGEALRLGVASKVWPAESFAAESRDYLAGIAANAPLTLKAIKLALNELAKPEAARDTAAADRAVAECFASQDYEEGRRAFAEKRAPEFRGR
ncbi:MAG: enoyl-CoA hydratase [Beijerinckiaceae bacterium]|nr:enoyl-CoA hydratase [Beijerinckiaceae bacterium]